MNQFILKNVCLGQADGQLIKRDILVVDGHLAKIKAKINTTTKYPNYDSTGFLAIPGLINLHVHPKSILLKGFSDELGLVQSLKLSDQYRLKDESNDYWLFLATAIEAIKTGTTCLATMGSNTSIQIKAFSDVGIRANIALPFYDDKKNNHGGIKASLEKVKKFLTIPHNDLITFSLGLPKIIDKNDQIFYQLNQIQKKYGCKFFIHLAENKKDYLKFHNKYGYSQLDYLAKMGLLNSDLNIIHGLHLNEKDWKKIITSGAKIIHCPTSNIKMGAGLLAIERCQKNIVLGTDGAQFSNSYNLLNEAKIALLTSRLTSKINLSVSTAFDFITTKASQALGLDRSLGRLQESYLADLALYDLNQLAFTPSYNIYSNLIYNSSELQPHSVMVNGQWVLRNYRPVNIDENQLIKKINTLKKLVKK